MIDQCYQGDVRDGLRAFIAAGVRAQVAQDLGRRWIGCELNPEYVSMQKARTAQLAMPI